MKVFCNKLNNVVEQNVPNFPTPSSHFPPWFNLELKNLTSEKTRPHAIWKESLRLQLPTQALDYREFLRVRSDCLRPSRSLVIEIMLLIIASFQ